MKKIAFLVFGLALVTGVVLASITSIGNGRLRSPVSFVFGSKVHGSGNIVTDNRQTGDFSGVDVGGILNVEIKKGETVSVIVEADDNVAPLIKTVVKDGTLKIWSEKKFKTKNGVRVFVSAPNIERIDSSGVAKVSYTGISGGSLEVEASGASKVELAGNVESLDIDMSGASRIAAKKLVAETADVDGSGAASLTVQVNSTLRADVSGPSSVNYSGDPAELKKSVSGAGRVNKID